MNADPLQVLRAWDVGAVSGLEPAGGTAGRTWRVCAASGTWFLRLRGARTSAPARLRFDHALRQHLVLHGVPTVVARPTRGGGLWHEVDAGVYELYPFVAGRTFDPLHLDEVAAAGAGLAAYHEAARGYAESEGEAEPIAQYTRLGFSDAVSDRMDDPRLQTATLRRVRELAPDAAGRRTVDAILARVASMGSVYAGDAYRRLTGWILHGDYTPANVLYGDDGELVGIFDLDWAVPGARCRDVADGLYFFATRPRTVDAADIWSLTAAAAFDLERCALFLAAYRERSPLAPAEIDALPAAFAGRWISIRLEGMAKIDVERRFEFFQRDIDTPLRWLDANWPALRAAL